MEYYAQALLNLSSASLMYKYIYMFYACNL